MSKNWSVWCAFMGAVTAFFFGAILIINTADHTWRYFPYQAGAWLIVTGAGAVAALIRSGWLQ